MKISYTLNDAKPSTEFVLRAATTAGLPAVFRFHRIFWANG